MTGAIVLITNLLFGTVATIAIGVAALTVFVALWYVLPLRRRFRYRDEGLPMLDLPADD